MLQADGWISSGGDPLKISFCVGECNTVALLRRRNLGRLGWRTARVCFVGGVGVGAAVVGDAGDAHLPVVVCDEVVEGRDYAQSEPP